MIQWSNSSDNESGAPFRLTLYIVRILLAVVQFIHFLRNHRTTKYSYFRVHSNSFFSSLLQMHWTDSNAETLLSNTDTMSLPLLTTHFTLFSRIDVICYHVVTTSALDRIYYYWHTFSSHTFTLRRIFEWWICDRSVVKATKIPKECQSLFNARCVVGVSWIKINYYYSQKSFQFSIIYLILWRFFLRLYLFIFFFSGHLMQV